MSKPRTPRWLITVSLVAALTFTAASASVYTGYMSTDAPSGLYTGPGGLWSHDVMLQWTIDSNQTDPGTGQVLWHYHYRFSVLDTSDDLIKFFVLETSPNFDPNTGVDFRSSNWKPGTYTAGLIGTGGSPGMPEAMQGIKYTLDGNRYTTMIMDFLSPRAPRWGDFYALGPNDGSGDNYVFNQGFKHPDTDPNIDVYPAQNGSLFDSILVPDTSEGNQVFANHNLRVIKFMDVGGAGAAMGDPNFRLPGWHIDVDGSNSVHLDANTDASGEYLFPPLDGTVSWRVSEEQQSGWTFTGAWLYDDANNGFLGKITDPNAIYVNLSTMDVDVFVGNIPEPATMALMIAGCAALAATARKRRARR